MKTDQSSEIINRLLQKWPDPKIELDYSNAFELLIATILAAQCTDSRVNMVTRTFFKQYPTADSIAKENPDVIADRIRSTGFYRNKAKSLIACCQRLVQDYGGQVPDSVEKLSSLPGVGRKTANIVLGNALGVQAIAVDTHLKRTALRLGLSSARNSDHVEQELMDIVDPGQWTLFTKLMILHGRYICQARRPRCRECPLYDICPYEEKSDRAGRAIATNHRS